VWAGRSLRHIRAMRAARNGSGLSEDRGRCGSCMRSGRQACAPRS
jgi:hypothetical protein